MLFERFNLEPTLYFYSATLFFDNNMVNEYDTNKSTFHLFRRESQSLVTSRKES